MSVPYFFEPFTAPEHLALSKDTMHHMLQVLRMRENETCWITNGKGSKCLIALQQVSKKNCSFQILDIVHEPRPERQFILAICFTKNAARIEWMLEKITEIGVAQIIPLQTERSEKNFFKRDRFEKILIAAMLQSQQTYLPILNELTSFADVCKMDCTNKLLAHCIPTYSKISLTIAMAQQSQSLIAIGPEGDFTLAEIELAEIHNWQSVHLGINRLRTETAGLYACVVFNSFT